MIFIYVLFFLIWFISNYKKYGFNASTFLISIYLLSGLGAVILLYFYNIYDISEVTFKSITTLTFFLFLFLSPIVKIGNKPFTVTLSRRHLDIFAWFIIIFSIITIIDSISGVKDAFSYGDAQYARSLYTETLGESRKRFNNPILNLIVTAGTLYPFFAMYFAFYYRIKLKNKFTSLMLFISSFSIVFYNLQIMGRDGIVRWIFMFIFTFLLFRDHFSAESKRRIFLILTLSSIPLIYIFYNITFARFAGRTYVEDFGLISSIINYIGQSPINFSNRFEPMFDYGSVPSSNVRTNVFSTFVGSLYFNYGFYITMIISILFYSIFMFIAKKNIYRSFPILILYIYIYQIEILGVFYHMFSSSSTIKYTLFLFMFTILINIADKIYKYNTKSIRHL